MKITTLDADDMQMIGCISEDEAKGFAAMGENVTLFGTMEEPDSKAVWNGIMTGHDPKVIWLDSPGGDPIEAIQIVKALGDYTVVVPYRATVASAATLIWAGASKRYSVGKPRVGVHATHRGLMTSDGAIEMQDSDEGTKKIDGWMGRYLMSTGAPAIVAEMQASTPQPDLWWVPKAELKLWGYHQMKVNEASLALRKAREAEIMAQRSKDPEEVMRLLKEMLASIK